MTMLCDDHNIDMLLPTHSEIEQEDDEKAEQNYAQQLLDSEAYDEDVHASGALATPQWITGEVNGVKPQQQMFNLADERGDEVYVGSDVIGGNKGTKKYTSSGKHAHLAAKVLKCFVEESPCNLYEMSRENTQCKYFLDVEWEESEFSGYSRLNSVVDAACTKFMDEFGIEAETVVLEGSRILGNGVWKRSNHIIFVNSVCASISGTLKSFVKDLVEENNENTLFWWDDKGKQKNIIDHSVYTRNRCFRTPLSAKVEDPTATKLQRIERIKSKDDAGNVSIVWEPRPLVTKEEILECLVSYIPDDLRQCIIPDSESASNSQRHASGVSQRKNPCPAPSEQNSENQAATLAQVQRMVDTAGGSGCVVDTMQQETDEGPMMILCKNDGPRTCLVTKDEVHKNNNAFIVVHPDGTVWYHCHATLCKDCYRNRVEIGKLSEPDSESSDDDEALNGGSSIDGGHDDAMHDDEAPNGGSSIDGGHDDAMPDDSTTTESDSELLQREEGVDIASSLGKRTATSISVGDDVMAENAKKKVCTGRATNEAQTDVSFVSLKCRKIDLSDVERVLGLVNEQHTSDGKELVARADRFKPTASVGSGDVSETGINGTMSVQTDPIETAYLETRADLRPRAYRVEQYVNGITKRELDTFSDTQKCKALSVVVINALGCEKDAKTLIKRFCTSKEEKNKVKRVFKNIASTSSTLAEIMDGKYALAVLQRRYAGSDKEILRCEYGAYDLVKQDVEKTYAKLTDPYCFVKKVVGKEHNSYSLFAESAVKGNLKNRYYYNWIKIEPEGDDAKVKYETVKLPFFDKWIRDEDIKTRSYPEFDPSNSIPDEDGHEFNMWLGFAAERLGPVSDEVSEQALARYYQHILNVVECPKVAIFILDYFSHILQRPEAKSGVSILLQGSQGCGKGTIFDTVREIIGHDISFQCCGAKAMHQLFGTFSIGLKNTVLAQIDEAKDMYAMNELLKDVVTIDRKQFEDKGVTPYKLKVFTNIVVTSNEAHPVPIPDVERRWVAVKCKEELSGNEAYFFSLRAFLKKPETQRGIYQALISRDISHINNMQSVRPVTPYYLQCRNISMCPLARFLSAQCNNSDSEACVKTVQSSVLYQDFRKFASDLGGDVVKCWNTTFFGLKMGEYANTANSGISKPGKKGKTGGVIIFIFNFDALRNHLISRHKYDENAEMQQFDFVPPGNL